MRMTTILALLLAWLTTAAAQPLPDFSGTWMPESRQSPGTGATVQSLEISQTADTLLVMYLETVQGRDSERVVTYDLTGEPVMNEQAPGQLSETITSIVGDELMTTWTSEGALPGTQTTSTETRALSADGRTMTVTMIHADSAPLVQVYRRRD